MNAKRKQRNLSAIVEGAMIIALAFVIHELCSVLSDSVFHFGGTITLAMIPLVYFSYRYGAGWGTLAAFAFSVLQATTGSSLVPPAGTWWSVILCILLDYVLAYTVIGVADFVAKLFGKHRLVGYGVGAAVVCFIRFICSFLSGVILWGSYAPEDMNVWVYSLVYNGGYMVPNIIITTVFIVLLCKIFDPKTLKRMPSAHADTPIED